ncbi:MAG: FAD-dependent oxidoreductase [Bacilli bacterium]|nr:FAD-dependent oxidoreductase [Bacilli bacterium]
MEHFDLIVIGFGKGGKTISVAAAKKGWKVAMIEKDNKMYGGTCINVACIPTKAISFKASLASFQQGSWEDKKAFYKKAVEDKDVLIEKLRSKNYHMLKDNPNIKVFDGTGSFIDAHKVKISSEGKEEIIEGEKIVIDTGARPFIPPINGINKAKRVYLSETLLSLKELPSSLVIIGGGYIGMEFASMFASFGSKVTIIQDSLAFLPREDEEIAKAVYDSLIARGIKIIKGAKITNILDNENMTDVIYSIDEKEDKVSGDAILVATGRRPNVSELNLQAAGVELTERNAIKVDEHLQTTQDNIYAVGDVIGGLQFTYISLDDYRILAASLFHASERTLTNRGQVPYSVFLDPPFSRVGLTEKEALEKGYDILVATLNPAGVPKAHILMRPLGLMKVIINKKDDTILGAHLFSAESQEVINLFKLAIDQKIPYQVLRDNIYTHPTMAEAINDLLNNIR